MALINEWLPIPELAKKVQKGEIKATELVARSLNLIKSEEKYQAIITLTEKRAQERARLIDDSVKNGQKVGQLAGVPFIAKDNFLTLGSQTTAASNILKGFTAPYQATAIERLEAEGAICLAKSNLDAFAHGSSTENSDFMVTKNPHDPTRVPGGSSGGSAVAVVLGLVPFALGTDTGGSIRLPASFCGVVGYKPTYGLVSRSGVVAMASSTDVIGPLTRSVSDASYILEIIAGKDQLDSTTIEADPAGYSPTATDLKGQRIGLIKEYMSEGLQPGVRKVIESSINKIRATGATIEEISLPSLPMALAVYYIICPAEVSSNLSRYDGQRYGYSFADAKSLDESYLKSRGLGFGKEAKRRIMIGTYVLSSGYYEAFYKRAQTVRTKLINEFQSAFERVDFLIGPTAPSTAFKIGENVKDPLRMYLADIMTVGANLVGIPAISLPAGLSGNMPVGLQLMAAQSQDRSLLSIAKKIEELLNV